MASRAHARELFDSTSGLARLWKRPETSEHALRNESRIARIWLLTAPSRKLTAIAASSRERASGAYGMNPWRTGRQPTSHGRAAVDELSLFRPRTLRVVFRQNRRTG